MSLGCSVSKNVEGGEICNDGGSEGFDRGPGGAVDLKGAMREIDGEADHGDDNEEELPI